MRIGFTAALLLVLTSCAGVPQVVFFGEGLSPDSSFRLGEAVLKNKEPKMGDELRSLQIGAASLAGMKLGETGNPGADFVADILYTDTAFIKGFRQVHSISVFLTIQNNRGESLAKVYFAEEGSRSFDSMKTLWDVTRLVWRKLSEAVKKL